MLILCAMDQEASLFRMMYEGGFAIAHKDARFYTLPGLRSILGVCGVGAQRVTEALEYALDGGGREELPNIAGVVLFGYCCSLDETHNVADIAVADVVVRRGQEDIRLDTGIAARLLRYATQSIDEVPWNGSFRPRAIIGEFATEDAFISTREEAERLVKYGAVFADQESYDAARVCRSYACPMGVVRVVSDIPGVVRWNDRARVGKALGTASVIRACLEDPDCSNRGTQPTC